MGCCPSLGEEIQSKTVPSNSGWREAELTCGPWIGLSAVFFQREFQCGIIGNMIAWQDVYLST